MKETGRSADTKHKGEYDKIINLPHHVSNKRKPMSIYDRAAQFASFQALTGFDDDIAETARLTEKMPELENADKLALNEILQILLRKAKEKPQVEITYFIPDVKKSGGELKTAMGNFKTYDEETREIVFTDKTRIPIDCIFNIIL